MKGVETRFVANAFIRRYTTFIVRSQSDINDYKHTVLQKKLQILKGL